MIPPLLRARTVGEILDMAFQIYRSRWAAMATATAVLILPMLALQAVLPLTSALLLSILIELFYLAASGAVVVIASEAYMGREVEPLTAVSKVLRRFFSVWGAAFMQGLIVGIGFLLLIIPGIIFSAWTFGMQQAVMIEGANASDSFERSKELAEDYVMHVLMMVVLAWVIGYVAVAGLNSAFVLTVDSVRLQMVFTNLVRVAINPLAAVVGTVLYYDLRIRKEAFDVAVATERLDNVPNEPVAAY